MMRGVRGRSGGGATGVRPPWIPQTCGGATEAEPFSGAVAVVQQLNHHRYRESDGGLRDGSTSLWSFLDCCITATPRRPYQSAGGGRSPKLLSVIWLQSAPQMVRELLIGNTLVRSAVESDGSFWVSRAEGHDARGGMAHQI